MISQYFLAASRDTPVLSATARMVIVVNDKKRPALHWPPTGTATQGLHPLCVQCLPICGGSSGAKHSALVALLQRGFVIGRFLAIVLLMMPSFHYHCSICTFSLGRDWQMKREK